MRTFGQFVEWDLSGESDARTRKIALWKTESEERGDRYDVRFGDESCVEVYFYEALEWH